MHPRWFFTLAALVLGCSAAGADSFAVALKVIDARNRPVAAAEAGLFWNVQKGVMAATGDKPARTDAAGRVVLQVDDWKEKRPVLVLSTARRLGGLITVSRADEGKEKTVMLRPTVHVTAQLRCRELPGGLTWGNTMVSLDGVRAPFAQNISTAPEFTLPPGKYLFKIYGTDAQSLSQTVTLEADQPHKDLGPIDLKAGLLAKLKGKPLPAWSITDARGVKPNTRLSDYRGKWVYIDFWGFW